MRSLAALILSLLICAVAAPVADASPFTDAVAALTGAIDARIAAIDGMPATRPLTQERRRLLDAKSALAGLGEFDAESDAPFVGDAGRSLGRSRTEDSAISAAAAALAVEIANEVLAVASAEIERISSLADEAVRRRALERLILAQTLASAAAGDPDPDAALLIAGKAVGKLADALGLADGKVSVPGVPEGAPILYYRQPGTRGTAYLWNTSDQGEPPSPTTYTVTKVTFSVAVYAYDARPPRSIVITLEKLARRWDGSTSDPSFAPGELYDLLVDALRARAQELMESQRRSYKGFSGIAIVEIEGLAPFAVQVWAL